MVQPSHPGNVGAAARALKTMGFHSLYLVTPRFPDVVNLPEAQALASGAADVLSSVRIVPTLAAALAPVSLAFALTSRARLLGPPPCAIRDAANMGNPHLHDHSRATIPISPGTS